MEFVDGPELPTPLEKPRNVAVLRLPEITVANQRILLGMHTDTINNLISFFKQLPERNELKVEGRILTRDQWEKLRRHPIYRFFMEGRIIRAQGSTGIIPAFIAPQDSGLSPEQMVGLMGASYSPTSLQDELGFRSGYFAVPNLIRLAANPNDYLPLFGGCNEIIIASDTLDSSQLAKLSTRITGYLLEKDTDIANFMMSPVTYSRQVGPIQPTNFYQSAGSQVIPLTKGYFDKLNKSTINIIKKDPLKHTSMNTEKEPKELFSLSKLDSIIPKKIS